MLFVLRGTSSINSILTCRFNIFPYGNIWHVIVQSGVIVSRAGIFGGLFTFLRGIFSCRRGCEKEKTRSKFLWTDFTVVQSPEEVSDGSSGVEDFRFFHFREEFVEGFMDEGIQVIFRGLAGVHLDYVIIAGGAYTDAAFGGFIFDTEG